MKKKKKEMDYDLVAMIMKLYLDLINFILFQPKCVLVCVREPILVHVQQIFFGMKYSNRIHSDIIYSRGY